MSILLQFWDRLPNVHAWPSRLYGVIDVVKITETINFNFVTILIVLFTKVTRTVKVTSTQFVRFDSCEKNKSNVKNCVFIFRTCTMYYVFYNNFIFNITIGVLIWIYSCLTYYPYIFLYFIKKLFIFYKIYYLKNIFYYYYILFS